MTDPAATRDKETVQITGVYVSYRLEEDKSSGRIHKRYFDEMGRPRLTDERCQRDDSGDYTIRESVDGAEPNALCQWDFPQRNTDV